MNPNYRALFNNAFTLEKYQQLNDSITADFNHKITFRVAESPFFISEELKKTIVRGLSRCYFFYSKGQL